MTKEEKPKTLAALKAWITIYEKRGQKEKAEEYRKKVAELEAKLKAEAEAKPITQETPAAETSVQEAEQTTPTGEDPAITTTESKEFKCGCGKVFRSAQALGGHRSRCKA